MMKVGAAGSTGNTINKKDLSYAGSSLALNFVKDYKKVSRYTDPTKVSGYTFTRTSGGYAETVSGTSMFFPQLRTNLLAQSQALTTNSWQLQNGAGSSSTATDNYSAAPNGTITATRLQYVTPSTYAQIFQYLSSATNATLYTFSIWLKSNTGSNQVISIGDSGIGPQVNCTVTPAWQRFSITQTTTSNVYIAKISSSGAGGTFDFLAWGAQLEPVTNPACTYPMDYIPTTTAPVSVSGGYGIANGGLMWFTGTRTNLALQSQNLINGNWTPLNCTVDTSTVLGPDNVNYLYKITSTATGNRAVNLANAVSGQTYTFSSYFTAGTSIYAGISIAMTTNSNGAIFNLSGSGSVISTTGPATANITKISSTIYRCSVTFVAGATSIYAGLGVSDGSIYASAIYPSAASGTVYGGFIQLETATDTRITYPTAYIPTTTAAVSVDTPRITNKGYLSEEARTNLLSYSQDYSNAYWSKNNLALTSTNNIAPDGTNTATLITATATFAQNRKVDLPVTPGSAYTISVFAKAGNYNVFSLVVDNSSSPGHQCAFTLTGNGSYVVSSIWASASATITALANGWYKCTLTGIVEAGLTTANIVQWIGLYSGIDYTGKSVYFWGSQVEQATYATSYIPTTTATASRSVDLLNYTNYNALSSSNWSIAANVTGMLPATGQYPTLYSINDGTYNNALLMYAYYGASPVYLKETAAGIVKFETSISNSAITSGSGKIAVSNNSNTIRGVANGGTVVNVGTYTSITPNSIQIAGPLEGYVQNLTIYPAALTDAKLQEITTPAIPEASFNASFADGTFSTSADGISSTYYSTASAMPGYTFTRASGGYAETVAGNLVYFNSGVPRITDKGYLSEEARTNLFLQSQNFENASWNKGLSTITTAATMAPDGILTGELVTATGTGEHHIEQNVSFVSGTTISISIMAKAAATSILFIWNSQTGSRGSVNLSTGAVTGSVTAVAIANGWYKVSVQYTPATTAGGQIRYYIDSTTSYTASGQSIYLWGAQLEAGAFPTSYIPTTTAVATRAADTLSYTAMSSILTANGPYTFTGSYIVAQNITGNSAIFSGYQTPSLGLTTTSVYLGRPSVANYVSKSITNNIGTVNKVAGRFVSGDFAVTANGLAPTKSTTTVTWPAYSQISIGIEGVSINGYVKSATIYPAALTDAQLQAITT